MQSQLTGANRSGTAGRLPGIMMSDRQRQGESASVRGWGRVLRRCCGPSHGRPTAAGMSRGGCQPAASGEVAVPAGQSEAAGRLSGIELSIAGEMEAEQCEQRRQPATSSGYVATD